MAGSNFPNGFAAGVTIRGVPLIQTHPGEVFWVNNSTTAIAKGGVGGSNNNDGSYRRPFSTVDYAISKCTANRGDIIFVMPGYTQTISAAAGIDADVAGIAIVGLGRGTNKPTLTFSATASDVDIDAANVLFSGFRCVSSVDSLVHFIDVNEDNATIDNCEFVTGSATEALCFINMATTKDGLTVCNSKFLQPTDPAGTGGGANTGGIYLVDSEDTLVENCVFRGQFESGIIHNKTTAAKGLVVRNCELSNELTVPFLLVATAEGVCDGCYGATLGATDATEAQVYGTIGTLFWISQSTSLGNDSGAGGQGSITGTVAS
jgi:hypothetical protein